MGQRSQIYVFADGILSFARYYRWNYGERMVSRCRGIVEHLKYYSDHNYGFAIKELKNRNGTEWPRMQAIADVNFDFRDVQVGQDIMKEYKEQFSEDYSFDDFVFYCQDNNDGKLFVNITEKGVSYAFTDDAITEAFDAMGYMEWDVQDYKQNLSHEDLEILTQNHKYLTENATLLSFDDVSHLIDTGGIQKGRK